MRTLLPPLSYLLLPSDTDPYVNPKQHWKEASKLLLSKHQQVQLLEAAAILKAASSGSSLPDEKSYW